MQRRRRLVEDVGAEIEKMRGELQRTVETSVVKGGSSAGWVGAGMSSSSSSGLPNPAEFDTMLSPSASAEDGRGGNDYYAAMEQQRQVELMNEQDEQLDGVFQTVGNLRQQANDMGRELEDQTAIIGEVDTLTDQVGRKLNNGMARLKYIVGKNEGESAVGTFAFVYMNMSQKRYLMYSRCNVFLLHCPPHLRASPAINLGNCIVMRIT